MFRVRYDMTEGLLRRVSNRTAGVVRTHSSSAASRRRHGSVATTGELSLGKVRQANSAVTGIASPLQAGAGMSQRYSPVFERAEDPTLAEDFMPADPQTQHKIFRNLIMFDPIAGPATEYWRDLAFGQNVILSGIDDEKVLQFYQDAVYASGIIGMMPLLLSDYLTFGKFVFHMLMDERLGYWNEVIPHDLDYVSIKVSPIPSMPPLVDLQPNMNDREWATSADPRLVTERAKMDPTLVTMMAAGRPIPLSPENTMFLPRRVFATDYYGTSYLTRVIPFKIYEKAILDASIAGARRRAGPLWHITVWPDASDEEVSEVLDLFFAAEEDPIGGKVVTREGVTVNTIGGGSTDFWKLSDEWTFLAEAKMRALGVSDSFLSGESNYNTMEVILSTFLEKVRSVRAHFTRKIIIEKMFAQLAQIHGYVKRSEAELSHGIRIGRKSHKRSESEYLIPTVEWDKPLSPVADTTYMEILQSLEESGLPIPIRMKAQVAGFDIDKALDSFQSDLETRKSIFEYKRAVVALGQQYGFDQEGAFTSDGKGGGLGGIDMGGEGFGDDLGEGDFAGFGEESLPDMGGGDLGGTEPAGELPAAAPTGGEGGVGADLAKSKFEVPSLPQRMVQGRVRVTDGLLDELKKLPLWDQDGGLFGLTPRRVAKVLDRIDHTDPTPRKRLLLAQDLPRKLRQQEGLDRMQSEVIQYLAIRMGYVPPVELTEETFDRLRKFITDRMEVKGLTKAITNEIVMLSKIAEAGGRKINSTLSRTVDPVRLTRRHGGALPDNLLLTGLTDSASSPFLK